MDRASLKISIPRIIGVSRRVRYIDVIDVGHGRSHTLHDCYNYFQAETTIIVSSNSESVTVIEEFIHDVASKRARHSFGVACFAPRSTLHAEQDSARYTVYSGLFSQRKIFVTETPNFKWCKSSPAPDLVPPNRLRAICFLYPLHNPAQKIRT